MFDVLTIAALADELTGTVLDGRVQRVGLLSWRSIGLEIYAGGRRRYLSASAENSDPHILLADREPAFDSQLVSPLLLLLRKYVRGGVVVGIEQPPLDRVVRVSIAKRLVAHNERLREGDTPQEPEPHNDPEEEDDPDGLADATFVHLLIEVMGRHSNIILVDDEGRIMEAVKRVTPAMSRVRPIAPKREYTDPPAPTGKADPRRLTAAECAALIGSERPGDRLAEILTRRLRGMSPQMAREIAFQATGSSVTILSEIGNDGQVAVARETRRHLEPLLTAAWAPRVYRDDEEGVRAFAAVPMAYLAADYREEAVATMSAAAALGHGEGDDSSPGRHAQRRARLEAAIRQGRDRVENRLTAMEAERSRGEDAERLRRWGEAIYANLWAIEPGQAELVVDGEVIPLDLGLSVKANAQELFEQYRKAQAAGDHVPPLIARAETELAYLDQLATLAAQAGSFQEIEEVAAEWEANGGGSGGRTGGRRTRRSTPPKRPTALVDRAGNAIYIGRSGNENDRITFDLAGPNDTWLHARGVPGSHVIVRWRDPGGEEEEVTLAAAAALAAHYSAARGSGSVEVDLTRRRYVRKIKGAGPGMVTYRNERTIAVQPRDEEAFELRGGT